MEICSNLRAKAPRYLSTSIRYLKRYSLLFRFSAFRLTALYLASPRPGPEQSGSLRYFPNRAVRTP